MCVNYMCKKTNIKIKDNSLQINLAANLFKDKKLTNQKKIAFTIYLSFSTFLYSSLFFLAKITNLI